MLPLNFFTPLEKLNRFPFMFSLNSPGPDYWDKIHHMELDFGACWQNCGSYCCNSNSEHLNLSLMKPNSAGMVFMPEEYNYLKKTGRLQDGFEKFLKKHTVKLDSEVEFEFYTSVCGLGGICSNCDYRPLICKLYPYFPYFNIPKAQIAGYIEGSAIDQFWDELKIEHPCWLVRTKKNEVLAQIAKTESVLSHPYVMFYLTAAAEFIRTTSEAIRTHKPELLDRDPKEFFKHWELYYLSGSLVDVPLLKKRFRNFYDQAKGVEVSGVLVEQ